jgi:hypothetical protein
VDSASFHSFFPFAKQPKISKPIKTNKHKQTTNKQTCLQLSK